MSFLEKNPRIFGINLGGGSNNSDSTTPVSGNRNLFDRAVIGAGNLYDSFANATNKAADKVFNSTFGQVAEDVVAGWNRMDPQNIDREARSTGRSFWTVFDDRAKASGYFSSIQHTKQYMDEGMSYQDAKNKYLTESTMNYVSGMAGESGVVKQKLSAESKPLVSKFVALADRFIGEREMFKAAEKPTLSGYIKYGAQKFNDAVVDATLPLERPQIEAMKGEQKTFMGIPLPRMRNSVLSELIPGEQVANELKSRGTAGGVTDFLYDQVKSVPKYHSVEVSVQDLITRDPALKEYIDASGDKVRRYSGAANNGDVIIGPKGDVADGYNRLHQAVLNGQEYIKAYAPVADQYLPETKNIMGFVDRTLRSPALSGHFLETGSYVKFNGESVVGTDSFNKIVQDIDKDGLDRYHFGEYMISKIAKIREESGIKTGRSMEDINAMIEGGKYLYEDYAQRYFNSVTKPKLDYWLDAGLGSQATYEEIVKNQDYAKLARLYSELEQEGMSKAGSSGVGGLSEQTLVKGITGSDRLIESPLVTDMQTTGDLFLQGEKNKTARALTNYYTELPGNPYKLKPIITSGQIEERKKLLEQISSANTEVRGAKRSAKTQDAVIARAEKRIEVIDKVTAKYNKSLSHELTGLQYKADAIFDELAVKSGDMAHSEAVNNVLKRYKQTEAELQRMYDDITLRSAKRDMAAAQHTGTAEGKISAAEKAKQDLQDIVDQRKADLEELKAALKDTKERKDPSKATFTLLNGGVKETWEMDKASVRSLKGLGVEKLNAVLKGVRLFTRVLQVGATGINVAFTGKNLVRDFFSGMLNTGSARDVLMAYPKAFKSAITHDDLYQELVRMGAGGTSFDMVRGAEKQTLDKIAASRSNLSTAAYKVKGTTDIVRDPVEAVLHPIRSAKGVVRDVGELYRALENTIGRSEELGRLAQYQGNKKAWLKQGYSEAEAQAHAANIARSATANFYRKGEIGGVINSIVPFFNAGIQGSRASITAFKNDPAKFATHLMATIILPNAAATYYNLSDPRRRAIYENMSKYEKMNNLIIVTPWANDDATEGVYKLPMNPNMAALGWMVKSVLGKIQANEPLSVWQDIGKQLIGTVSPITPEMNSIMSMAPPIGRVPYEILSNYNTYTGQPIVPQSMQGMNPEDIYKQGKTSMFSRLVSEGLNEVGIGINPMQTEHAISGFAGQAGGQTAGLFDRAGAAVGAIKPEDVGGRSIPQDILHGFKNPTMGEKDRQANDEITKYQMDSKSVSTKRNNLADKLFADYKADKLDYAELDAAETKYPGITKDIRTLSEEDARGLTKLDKRIQSLGVESGARAKYIVDQMKKMNDTEQYTYLEDLSTKKIITKDVLRQIYQLQGQ